MMTIAEFDSRLAVTCGGAVGVLMVLLEAGVVPDAMLPITARVLLDYRETLAQARSDLAILKAQSDARAAAMSNCAYKDEP
jgi:hypothetical protein